MYLKKKMKTKIVIVVILALGFLYWRGIKNVSLEKGWNCKYHVVYAICDAKNNKAKLPGFFDIIKAGAKF
ncbi:MAG: hypothetical protein KW804_01320 [Candidatus Doudnabacteria bacterium]|nr:hypothetical protein [Candidatus Doudnabacteria bacterium]